MSGRLDLSQYTLVEASKDQIRQHCEARLVPWGKGKTTQDLVDGEERETTVAWGEKGALKVWVLVKRDDSQGQIYSGCSTYRRKAFMKRKGSSEVEDTWMYGVASVVTPVHHHRNGYASHMLKLLHYYIAPSEALLPFPKEWGSPPPHLAQPSEVPPSISSVLWSDVGSTFYSKCTIGPTHPGWVMTQPNNTEIVWKILPPSTSADSEKRWEHIKLDQLESIGKELSELARRKMSKIDTSDKSVYQFDPASHGLLQFMPTKGLWSVTSSMNFDPTNPCGFRLKAQNGEDDTIVLFTAYSPSIGKRLMINYIYNLQPKDLPSLLKALDPFAGRCEDTEGWCWGLDLNSELVKTWAAEEGREVQVGQRGESMGHLLGAAWYGPEGEEHELLDPQPFGWC